MSVHRTLAANLFCLLLLTVHAWSDTTVVARANVPNTLIKQGEVRLVLQDGDTIVQTILHTRFQNLVKKRIVRNEKKNWPDSQEAVDYLAALEEALVQYASQKREAKGPIGLVIDFVDGLSSDRVDFSFVSVGQGDDGFRVEQPVLWRSLSLSKDYIHRNQEHIVADVFGQEAAVVLEKLRDLRSNQTGRFHE